MQNRFKILLLLIFASFVLYGFNKIGKNSQLQKEYDFGKPEIFAVPEILKEISGITLYNGQVDTIYAVQDEEDKLFRLEWKKRKVNHIKFGGKGDYEDLAILKDKLIVLKSNGDLYSFSLADVRSGQIRKTDEWKNLLPRGEYEGLYADQVSGDLFVLCKNCTQDKTAEKVSGYIFKMTNGIKRVGTFSVDVEKVKAISGMVKKGFRPSALAKNPVTGDWFILSSSNKALVILDKSWKPKEVYSLNSNNFNQPEGIAFDKSGNLYISNEGNEIRDGNILKFRRLIK